ncbi:hypothetical protein O71_15745 [Pontibacter sp. BAB1700]|nr:hypothetical protein O71_15745 [Pontibacter sp. BAB1700]
MQNLLCELMPIRLVRISALSGRLYPLWVMAKVGRTVLYLCYARLHFSLTAKAEIAFPTALSLRDMDYFIPHIIGIYMTFFAFVIHSEYGIHK